MAYLSDFEVPGLGEWDGVVENGTSMCVQRADAAWPERGKLGLRVATTVGNTAYVQKDDVGLAIASGTTAYLAFWLYLRAAPVGGLTGALLMKNSVPQSLFQIRFRTNGVAYLIGYFDAGSQAMGNTIDLRGRWHHVVVEVKHSASGWVKLYIDGALVGTLTGDNTARADAFQQLQLGCFQYGRADYVADFDEVTYGTSYPEPFAAEPADEYLSLERTVVLLRRGSADSLAFGDACVERLGIPRANLCPLPNAGATETLADYATFQSEVETDLAAWLSRHAIAAGRCMSFLVGYGVPGAFTVAGVDHSATSRLMNYGSVFSSGAANALYNPTTVARLTHTALQAAGQYLATRIDADTLAHAEAILDAGLAVSGMPAVPEADWLFTDEADFAASLVRQHLRIQPSDEMDSIADAAALWGISTYPAAASGSRAVACETYGSSASTLRSGSSQLGHDLLNAGYAAGMGSAETAEAFDAESFFEMLRIGGSFAEAAAVAQAHVDYTGVAAGIPGMTVAWQAAGYDWYLGAVDPSACSDENSPDAHTRAGDGGVDLALALSEDTDYWLACTAVSNSGVVSALSLKRKLRIEGGALVGPPPNDVAWAALEAIADGYVRLTTYYNAFAAEGAAVALQVAPYAGGSADWANLLSTIAISGTTHIRQALSTQFADGQTVRVAVRAVTAAGVAGGAAISNPVAADATAPDGPDSVEVEQVV